MNNQVCLLRKSFQQTFACRIFLADFRYYIDAIQFFFRKLTFYIKATDRFYLIPEKVDTIGKLERIGKYVEDTTTDGILSRFVNIINLLESITVKYICHEHIVELLTRMNLQRILLQGILRNHFLGNGFRIGNDHKPCFRIL